jgi:hypothetical protein
MRRTILVAPVLSLALAVCLAGPAAAVPKDLQVTSATCSGVRVTGRACPPASSSSCWSATSPTAPSSVASPRP